MISYYFSCLILQWNLAKLDLHNAFSKSICLYILCRLVYLVQSRWGDREELRLGTGTDSDDETPRKAVYTAH